MIDIRLTAIAGVVAAFLSLLFGIIGDVTAGAVFSRALLSGILFAAFIAGAQILVKQFLPDLGAAVSDDETEDAVEASDTETGGKVNIVLDDSDDVPFAAGGLQRENADDDSLSEEVEELSGEDNSGEFESVEELTPADDDAVPDIGVFENTFQAVPQGLDSIDDGGRSENSVKNSSFDVLGGSHNASEAAKAIQTILKKEQEG